MSVQHVREADDEQFDEQFGPAVRQPFPLYTLALVTAVIIVAIAQFVFGLNESIASAGFVKPYFLKGHEYWRILTGAALHGGALHIALNAYALYSFGRLIEMLANRAHLAIVFLLSAICGNLLSLVFIPDGVSVGASGGIVGLVGYLAVYAFKRKDFISPEFRRSLVFNIGFIFVYGLLLFQNIDNYAHLGGLIAGGGYALLQVPRDPYKNPADASVLTGLAGVGSLAVFLLTAALSVLLIANTR